VAPQAAEVEEVAHLEQQEVEEEQVSKRRGLFNTFRHLILEQGPIFGVYTCPAYVASILASPLASNLSSQLAICLQHLLKPPGCLLPSYMQACMRGREVVMAVAALRCMGPLWHVHLVEVSQRLQVSP
jgi:hypothetical protein